MKARDNPFRAERINNLPFVFPDDDTMEQFIARLKAHQNRGAIVGHHGSGKSTLLQELRGALKSLGIDSSYLRLRDVGLQRNSQLVQQWLADSPAESILLLDSAGRLDRRSWLRVESQSERHPGLVITVHRPEKLPTLLKCCGSKTLLRKLVAQLGQSHNVSESHSDAVFEQCRGNLRECFRCFYDEFST